MGSKLLVMQKDFFAGMGIHWAAFSHQFCLEIIALGAFGSRGLNGLISQPVNGGYTPSDGIRLRICHG
mgnify:CR=1 FL=1|jgi:hypothetical protein